LKLRPHEIVGTPVLAGKRGRAMPHYNFYFSNGKCVCSDAGGLDLPDDGAAREEAKLTAYDLWSDPREGVWNGWTVEVTDEKARRVISIPVGPGSQDGV
jgi:hypothetical protein